MKLFRALFSLCGFLLLLTGCGSNSTAPTTPSGSNSPSYTYPLLNTFGGSNLNDEIEPQQIAVHNGTLFVADDNDEIVQKFDLFGNFIGQFSTQPSSELGGIAVDKNGLVYVADDDNYEIDVYDQNGNFQTSWAQGSAGLDPGFGPWNIYIDGSNNVYVVDYQGCDCVVKMADGSGTWTTGSTGYLSDGYSLTMGHDGKLYVPDQNTGIIYIVDPSTMLLGSPISQVPNVGPSSSTVLVAPTGIVTDKDGNLLITDDGPNHVIKITTGGTLLKTISNSTFQDVETIAIDPSQNLYIGDDDAGLIYKYAPY
jgi:streptogramin lyase